MKKALSFPLFFLLSIMSLPAQVSFGELSLSDDNRLLFAAESRARGGRVESALVLAKLDSSRLRLLTASAAHLEYLSETREVQLRNSFALQRIPLEGGLPKTVQAFPGFEEGVVPSLSVMDQVLPSPDGAWLLRLEPSSGALGRLVLIDIKTGSSRLVAEGLERPGRFFPASWSPDSRLCVYAREGALYYLSLDSGNRPAIAERYRLIGEGQINSLEWGRNGDFYYLRDNAIYRVHASVLFARALYASFIEVGTLAGKIPFSFDPQFDRFWPAPDSSSILLSKGGTTLFWFPLASQEETRGKIRDEAALYPCLVLPSWGSDLSVIQSDSGIVTLLLRPVNGSQNATRAWRLANGANNTKVFHPLDVPAFKGAALSPAGNQLLLWGDGGLELWDYINWKAVGTISTKPCFHAAWTSNEDLVMADAAFIEYRSLAGARRVLSLARAEEYAFEEDSGAILAKTGNTWYRTDGKTPWTVQNSVRAQERKTGNMRYRVYLEKQPSGPYRNLPMLRQVDSVGTRALVRRPLHDWDESSADAAAPEPADNGLLFSHGLRQGRREVAITFDVSDDAEGLQYVLSVLERYGLRATFFLGGEFIRRHPGSAKDIADLGHECASLFFANMDFFDSRYHIDGEFVKRGLARNEDDFYNATGHELSLLWHPPWYNSMPAIEKAAKDVGYTTVGRDVEPFDWVSWRSTRLASIRYLTASEIVDRVLAEKRPGSIIPVRLGRNPGGRDDYFFHRLDVLLDALLSAGYEVVPVSRLIDQARR